MLITIKGFFTYSGRIIRLINGFVDLWSRYSAVIGPITPGQCTCWCILISSGCYASNAHHFFLHCSLTTFAFYQLLFLNILFRPIDC